ncbi:DNA mismatch repair protein MSH7 [Linum grandiflorum]
MQKTIHSFFQKSSPAPANRSSGSKDTAHCQSAVDVSTKQRNQDTLLPSQNLSSSEEVRGTDTPPEKVPRQILPPNYSASSDSGGPSLFSSILHKFAKVPSRDSLDRNQADSTGVCLTSRPAVGRGGSQKLGTIAEISRKDSSAKSIQQEFVLPSDGDDDVPGPETPGLQPLVSRFKRIHEEIPKLGDKFDCSLLDTGKRAKLVHDFTALGKNKGEVSDDLASKFEWLNPAGIRDANRRRPDHPLYDKKTLYIPPDTLKKMSASQKQYWTVKSQYMDVLLFFKVGKFYELYELDAEIGHKELDWKITLSGVGKCRQVGISEFGIDDAIEKLVARGFKVGRVEQLETADQAKARGGSSVITRKLVQVLTPSTTTDGIIGPDAVHLLALKEGNNGMENGGTNYGFAFVDCAALRFWVGSIRDDASCSALGALLMQISPKEVIYESRGLSKEAQKALKKFGLAGSAAPQLTPVLPPADFEDASEVRNLIQLKGFFSGSSSSLNNALDSLFHKDLALSALGGLTRHLSRLMLDDVLRNGDVLPYEVYKGCLKLDGQTLVNLEIFSNNADGGLSGTLFNYLNSCDMSSGKRLLRKWICHPLKCATGINNRLDAVEVLTSRPEVMLIMSQYLRRLPDLERLLGRVKASIQASACLALPLIGKKVLKQRVKVFGTLVKGLRGAIDLLSLIQNEEQLNSPLSKVFEIPELKGDSGLDKFLSQFEAAVDSEFPDYQNHEVTDSEAETLTVLFELFVEKAREWSEVIHAINCIDVLRSFALKASTSFGAMSRPVILPETSTTLGQEIGGPLLKIKGLWHPFALGENGQPVPNDLHLGEDSNGFCPRTLLLTGPNMGGKSTLLRATCLAVILAQLGCFVPSEKCELSLVDVIFTRLGATDRIMSGESTFLVECSETASILESATQDSLVILDELGRGTSTFDGYAIAYAVLRHLVEKVNCRLLFATHYHPLTKEFASHPHVSLQHMACTFRSNSESSNKHRELVFLYKLTSGACPSSYGMQIALMAGIPDQVVESASQAAKVMHKSVGESFKMSEQRSEFSTLHEEWVRSLVSLVKLEEVLDEDDVYDTLICLWHELKSVRELTK